MGTNEQAPLQPNQAETLDPRELAQVLHARTYARDFADAGAPGHGQFLLIAKLSRIIDVLRAQVNANA